MKLDSPRSDTNFLRFVAIVLIVNSHLDAYYPWPVLGTGGALGNSLFFMLSAFGLAASWRHRPRPFSEWYGRRIRRIFPPIWVFLALFVFPVAFVWDRCVLDPQLDFLSFVWFPPNLWFIRALLVFYLIVFVIISRGLETRVYLCLFALMGCVAYAAAYVGYIDLSMFSIENPPFKVLFYLLVVLFGIELAGRSDRITYAGVWDVVGLVACVVLIYSHKLLLMRGVALRLQCLQQCLILPVLYYSMKVARSEFIVQRVMCRSVAGRPIRYVSGLTLEIYLVHGVLKEYFVTWPLRFPGNIVVLASCTLISAALVKFLASLIQSKILIEKMRPSADGATASPSLAKGSDSRSPMGPPQSARDEGV